MSVVVIMFRSWQNAPVDDDFFSFADGTDDDVFFSSSLTNWLESSEEEQASSYNRVRYLSTCIVYTVYNVTQHQNANFENESAVNLRFHLHLG